VNYETGLFLSEGESLSVENANVTIKEQIVVLGGARLSFVNCSVDILSTPSYRGSYESEIEILSNGELVFDECSLYINVDLTPNYHTNANIIVRDQSSLKILDSNVTCSNYVLLQCFDESETIFNGSRFTGHAPKSSLHFGLEDFVPEGILREYFDDYIVSANQGSKLTVIGSKMGRIGAYDNASCSVFDSSVVELIPDSSETVRVRESSVKALQVSKRNGTFAFTGRLGGHCETWDSESAFHEAPIDSRVELVDSDIELFWLILIDCEAQLSGAELGIVHASSGNLGVCNSSIWLLNIRNDGLNTVRHSEIGYLTGFSDELRVSVEDSDIGWFGASGRDSLNLTIANSSMGECQVNRFLRAPRATASFTGVEFQDLEITPSRSLRLHFDDCVVNSSLSVNPLVDASDEIEIYGSLSITPTASLNIEAQELFDSTPAPSGSDESPERSNLVPFILVVVILFVIGLGLIRSRAIAE
jgi:hypothetical protein